MDFLDFGNISFCANTNIRQLCQVLNSIMELSVWYYTQIKNSEWLWLVSNIVATINSDKIICGFLDNILAILQES